MRCTFCHQVIETFSPLFSINLFEFNLKEAFKKHNRFKRIFRNNIKKGILEWHKSNKLCVRGLKIGTIDNVGGLTYSIKLITLFPLSLFPICVFFTNQNKCPPPISASWFVFLDSPWQRCSSSAVQPALLFTLPEVRQIFKMCVHLSCFLLRLCIYLSFFIFALKLCTFTDLT